MRRGPALSRATRAEEVKTDNLSKCQIYYEQSKIEIDTRTRVSQLSSAGVSKVKKDNHSGCWLAAR